MAQTGFTPIQLYSSATPTNAPSAGNLTNDTKGSELAINIADKNLFFKDSTNAVNTVPIRQSGAASDGWLSSTDWNTFNNKQPAGTYVNSVTGTAPVVSSGGTNPAISMAAATTSVNGYLTSTDWNTFNGKQAALVSGTNIKTVGGASLLGSGDVGTIGIGYGGTGQTSFTTGQIHYGSFSTSANLFWDSANNRLGVGTSSPGYSLSVNGGTATRISADTTSGVYYNRLVASQTFAYSGIEYASLFNFVDGATERARFDSSGSLLVGITTALQSTHTFYNASNPAGVFYRPISSGGAAITSFFSDVGGVATFKSYVDSAGAFTTVSDVRTKKNVEPISTGLGVVAKLRPVSFNWRYEDDALPKTNGFIAQEVELVYPEAVTTMDVSKSNGYVDQKMMKNDALLPILVKALQELNEKFDAYVASHP